MGAGRTDQQVAITVDGVLRRVTRRRLSMADGTVQTTYWDNGQLVVPDAGSNEPVFVEDDGCSAGCQCNRCQPERCEPAPCDPCANPCGGARQPKGILAGTVSGSPMVGSRLTYDPGVWTNALDVRAYWYRGSVRMGSARQPYVLTDADVGYHVHVVELAIGMGGDPPAMISNSIGPIVAGSGSIVQLLGLPLVTGIAQVDQLLTYTPGTWTGNPVITAYWQRSSGGGLWSDIGPAGLGVPYTIQQTDLGSAIRIREMANGQQALTAYAVATSAVSAAPASNTAPANVSPPVIGGTAVQGSTVIYSAGSWTGTPAPAITARWRVGETDLGPATSGVPFTVPASAVGGMLRVVETAVNVVNTVNRESNQLGPVTAMVEPPANVSPPYVTGSLAIGQTLTYVAGAWIGTPTPTVAAVWQRNNGSGWVDAGPATTARVIAASDVGSSFRVLETANSGGQVRTLASEPRGPVVASATPPAATATPVIAGTPEVGQNFTYTPGTWTGTPVPSVSAVWQRSNGLSWTTIVAAVAGTPYTVTPSDVGRTLRVLETAAGSTTVTQGSNEIGPVEAVVTEEVLFELDPTTDSVAFMRTGLAPAGTITLRPYLPWNHEPSVTGFDPINDEPQVYVYSELLGNDNQPLNINPFSLSGGMLTLSATKTPEPLRSRINWPGSANATRGYWTSGSFMTTEQDAFQYGDIEIEMRVSDTIGGWPGFWLVPAWGEDTAYEIDSPELRSGTNTKFSVNYFQIDWNTGVRNIQPLPGTWGDLPAGKTTDQFVKYRTHWTREFIRYYVDGQLVHEVVGHDFHTLARIVVTLALGNGIPGWQDYPVAATTTDPIELDINHILWKRSSEDALNMPVILTRPAVTGGANSMIAPGQDVTITPGTVSGATLAERILLVGSRKVTGAVFNGNIVTIPANIDDFIAGVDGSWNPVNVLERWTNPQGGITINRSTDVLYRVKGAAAPPSSSWLVDQQRIVSQDIGGAEWYKYGVTFVGNNVTEDTSTGEHGVGLSGMARTAGQIDVLVEAVVSGIEGHTILQMQVADGAWGNSAIANYPIPSGTIASFDNGWTALESASTDLGGGQRKLALKVRTDATTTNFVWLLRGFNGTTVSYAGSTTRKFTLVSASIKRVGAGSGSLNEQEVTGISAQAPGNNYVPAGVSSPWGYNRNVFGQDGLIDGTDFTLRQYENTAMTWPGGFRFEWSFPNSDPNPAANRFCWGYPALTWGRGPWGPTFGTSGHPDPVAVNSIGELKVGFDAAFTGQNGADLMIDVYTLPDTAFDGDSVNEVSVFLSHNGVGPMSWLTTGATATHTFSAPMGDCAIYKQPTSSQIMVMPRTGSARREVMAGEINLKEILQHLVSIGLVDGTALVAGFEFGVEPQRPNEWNAPPYSGTMKWNTVPYATLTSATTPTNLLTTPVDFTNTALWNPNGVTATVDTMTEDTSGATHGLERLGMARAAGAKTYRISFDVQSTTYLGFSVEVMNSSWDGSSGGIYRFGNAGPESGSNAVQGGWSIGPQTMTSLGDNTYRISHTFTTDATSTGFNILLRGVVEDGGGMLQRVYTGNGTRSAKITNLVLAEV